MSEASTAPGIPKDLGRGLRAKLGAVGRKLVRVEVMRRGAVAISVAVVGLALFLAVDWLVDLPMETRVAILAALATVVAVLLLRAVVAVVTQRRDEESLALMVERKEPGFRSRLIASVQFARGKASVPDEGAQALVERLVADTESFARPLVLTEVVNTGPLKRALVVLLVLGGLAAVAYYAGGAITQDLLRRAFLADVPVPRATKVVWTTGDLKIGIGDPVTVEARAVGHRPESGVLRVRFASGRKENLRMEPRAGEPDLFSATLENVQESFTYLAAIHDGRSERHRIRAFPRPTVTELSGRQTYPGYTKLPPSTHRPGEFLLFPGSRLDLTITASQPLKSGAVRLVSGKGKVLSFVDPKDSRLLHASFQAEDENLTGFTVELRDTEEMPSQDATVYRVDILKDEPPKVRIVKPSRQRELVTSSAKVLIGYEAEDRFGIERIVLAYSTTEEESETREIELPLTETGARKVAESHDWDLAQLAPGPQVGEEIEFWIEAYDQNENTAAGASAKRTLKIVTPREKRDDLLSRAGDSLGRIDQATEDQERLNAVLAEWIRSQSPLPDPDAAPQSEIENGNEE